MNHGLGKMSRALVLAASAATLLAALAACTGGGEPSAAPTPSATSSASSSATSSAGTDACADGRKTLVAAVQRYVDGYGAQGTTGKPSASATPPSSDTALQNAIAQSRDEISRKGCDVTVYEKALRTDLAGVRARGPLASAVLLRIATSLDGSAQTVAQTRDVGPGDDLPRALAEVGPGSTLRLAAGTYRLDESLVLLQGVTLRGAGAGRTVLTSPGAGSVVLVLTDGRVELSRLAVRHTGRRAASGVIGGPTSSVVLRDARVSGARGGTGPAGGGAGVLMSANADSTPAKGTTLEVTRTTFSGNSGAGVLLAGRHRVSVRASRFDRNGQCGVCFTGASGGTVRSSRFTANAAGVAALDGSRPVLVDDTFSGGLVGVQASGRAKPVVLRARVAGSQRAALIFGDASAGKVDRTTCRDVKFGIVVGPKTYPTVGSNDGCAVAGSR